MAMSSAMEKSLRVKAIYLVFMSFNRVNSSGRGGVEGVAERKRWDTGGTAIKSRM